MVKVGRQEERVIYRAGEEERFYCIQMSQEKPSNRRGGCSDNVSNLTHD